jgi:hypothetical protein
VITPRQRSPLPIPVPNPPLLPFSILEPDVFERLVAEIVDHHDDKRKFNPRRFVVVTSATLDSNSAAGMPSSRWIDGSATFTTLKSNCSTNWAAQIMRDDEHGPPRAARGG